MSFSVMCIVIVKFSNWLLAIVIRGIKHEACACLLSGVEVDENMGPGCTALIIVLHMECVMCTAHGWLHILV